MIKYLCRNCNDLECDTSLCPVCRKRTDLLSSEIYYCTKCKTPSFTNKCPICDSDCIKLGSDLRPVFAQERLLLEVLLGEPMKYAGKDIWVTSSNVYWVDGEKVKINMKEAKEKNPKSIIPILKEYEEQNRPYVDQDFSNLHIKTFIETNKYR